MIDSGLLAVLHMVYGQDENAIKIKARLSYLILSVQ
jgi:hypothetical protein